MPIFDQCRLPNFISSGFYRHRYTEIADISVFYLSVFFTDISRENHQNIADIQSLYLAQAINRYFIGPDFYRYRYFKKGLSIGLTDISVNRYAIPGQYGPQRGIGIEDGVNNIMDLKGTQCMAFGWSEIIVWTIPAKPKVYSKLQYRMNDPIVSICVQPMGPKVYQGAQERNMAPTSKVDVVNIVDILIITLINAVPTVSLRPPPHW